MPALSLLAGGRQDPFRVAVRLLAALEDQVACGLEGRAVVTGRHRLIVWITGVLAIDDFRHAPHRRHDLLVTMPCRSQLATCWLEMRKVARSSIRPTSWISGTFEQPTPWSTQRTT